MAKLFLKSLMIVLDEIGGNKVLLEDREIRVFLDFGQSFTLGADYFTSWLSLKRALV